MQALNIRRQLFGDQNPDTAASLNNVGYTYREMGNHNEAIKYLERAFDILSKPLGELHRNTAVAFENLVYSLIKLKRFPEAGEKEEEEKGVIGRLVSGVFSAYPVLLLQGT